MKRSLLLSKVRKSSDKNVHSKRHRRPSKKLVASLEALTSALPELPANGSIAKSRSSAAKANMTESLEQKRGLTKRREKLVKAETERFGRNMAILSMAGAVNGEGREISCASRQDSWKALRRHLESTIGKP
jgi:hypothetical protein